LYATWHDMGTRPRRCSRVMDEVHALFLVFCVGDAEAIKRRAWGSSASSANCWQTCVNRADIFLVERKALHKQHIELFAMRVCVFAIC
jgi:hypothetical protein